MDETTYQRLSLRVDAGWRTVVRRAAYLLAPRLRCDPAFRAARKRLYRAALARHGKERRELLNAFRL